MNENESFEIFSDLIIVGVCLFLFSVNQECVLGIVPSCSQINFVECLLLLEVQQVRTQSNITEYSVSPIFSRIDWARPMERQKNKSHTQSLKQQSTAHIARTHTQTHRIYICVYKISWCFVYAKGKTFKCEEWCNQPSNRHYIQLKINDDDSDIFDAVPYFCWRNNDTRSNEAVAHTKFNEIQVLTKKNVFFRLLTKNSSGLKSIVHFLSQLNGFWFNSIPFIFGANSESRIEYTIVGKKYYCCCCNNQHILDEHD